MVVLMASASEVVLCPVCSQQFDVNAIENHANVCLDRSSSEMSSPRIGGGAKKRRVDVATWCKPTTISKTEGDTESGSKTNDSCRSSPPGLKELSSSSKSNGQPLADMMRPITLSEFIGQDHVLGANSVLRRVLEGHIPSMILWGPPGCGKTSLAHVIASQARQETSPFKFLALSATNSGTAELKDVIKKAKNDWMFFKRKTVLFMDEIHRFNKLQQDTFLPAVEDGTITLIGATTENPSFSLNSALLSRCRVIVFEKLNSEHIESILRRALQRLEMRVVEPGVDLPERLWRIESDAVSVLANLSDGDARIALNCLQLAVESCRRGSNGVKEGKHVICASDIKECLQRSHFLYDRKGDEHYNCISALHKCMRGHDADASLYWLGRMLEGGEDPLYVARRLIRFASEDVGLADPLALNQAVAAYQGCHFIGMPECEVILAQCVVYLAKAPKSIQIYEAYSKVKQCIRSHEGPLPGVPLHLRNAPTKLMKDLGYSKGYKYNPAFQGPVEQEYFPECLKGTKFLND